MTRRIALFILGAVWLVLIAAAAGTYWTVRSSLLADLDATIVARAMALPQVAGTDPATYRPAKPDDRYLVQGTEPRRTVARPTSTPWTPPPPMILEPVFSTLGDGTRVRTITLRALAAPAAANLPPLAVTITYSTSAAQFDRLLDRLALMLALVCLGAGGLASFAAYRIARSSLAPLRETAQAIGAIDEHNLARRIDVARLPPELTPMADRLNEMLGRLEQAFTQRKQFLSSASHELRTPVAAMVTALEVALRHPREPEAYRQVLTSCLSDARLLRTLVQRLMEQVRAETDLADEPAAPVDAAALLDRCVQMIQPLAAQRQVELARSYTGPLEAVTRASRLRSIVTNLLDNAIAYNRPGGRVELACRRTDDQLVLSVRDTGIGIAPEHLPHVFEPFFRVDGNGLECEHLGLGLALVRAHVQALGGQVRAESSAGQWTQFTVSLPAGGSPAEEQKNNDVI